MRTCLGALLASLVFLTAPSRLFADAHADLASGRELIAAGDFEKGLALLTAGAQNLPQAVEPQLALAEAYLKLGKNEKALVHFRKVLTLSPEHAQARRIIEALTGRRQTVAERLELAKTFVAIGAFQARRNRTASGHRRCCGRRRARRRASNAGSNAAVVGQLRCRPRRGRPPDAILGSAAQGRVLAALALLGQKDPDLKEPQNFSPA